MGKTEEEYKRIPELGYGFLESLNFTERSLTDQIVVLSVLSKVAGKLRSDYVKHCEDYPDRKAKNFSSGWSSYIISDEMFNSPVDSLAQMAVRDSPQELEGIAFSLLDEETQQAIYPGYEADETAEACADGKFFAYAEKYMASQGYTYFEEEEH